MKSTSAPDLFIIPQPGILQAQPTMAAMRPLQELMQTLPEELFDIICDYTFSPDVESARVTKQYKPPLQMSVNRPTRSEAAIQHYTGPIVFKFDFSSKKNLALAWLNSLPYEHLQMIQSIEFESQYIAAAGGHFNEATRYIAKKFMEKERRGSRFTIERSGKALSASFERFYAPGSA